MTGLLHPAARDLLLLCADAGWDVAVGHGVDTGGSPYVTVRAARQAPDGYLDLTWHTRATGTYRLFSCLLGRSRSTVRDSTLRDVKALVRGERAPGWMTPTPRRMSEGTGSIN